MFIETMDGQADHVAMRRNHADRPRLTVISQALNGFNTSMRGDTAMHAIIVST
jgi:hypothetical protein